MKLTNNEEQSRTKTVSNVTFEEIKEHVHPAMPIRSYKSMSHRGTHITRLFVGSEIFLDMFFGKEGIKIGHHHIKWSEIPEEFMTIAPTRGVGD